MKDKKKYYLLYSGLFLLLVFICFGIYLLMYHKSLLRFWDTYNQHYICFIKMGKWFRSIIRNGSIRIWDPALGYGADFFLTLSGSNSGSVFDPINWLSVLVPAEYAEYAFTVTVFLRLYLCGIAFSILAFRKKAEGYAALCGALTYTFCACAYVGLYQFSFIVPMYVFPFVICGVDELFENNRATLYTISLALSALWSYYFTYMTAILVVAYCIIKWFYQKTGDKNIKRFFLLIGRFILYSSLAAGMAAVVLFPLVKVLSGMSRLELERYVPTLYDAEFYQNMIKGLIGTYDMGARDCQIGFCLVAFLCLTGLFVTEKEYQGQLKTELILMAIALCVPFAGHVMNAFSYTANRWIWAFALAVGLAVTVMLPKFREMSSSRKILLCGVCLGYLWVVFEICGAGESPKWYSLAVLLLALCGLLILIGKMKEVSYRKLAVFLTCITIALQAFYNYSDKYLNYFSNNIDADTAYVQVKKKGGIPLLNKINTANGTRYVSDGLDEDYNAGWIYNKRGINFYYSCYDEGVNQFQNSLALKTNPCAHRYMGLDNRSELMALLGVNYYINAGERKPIGYDKLTSENKEAEQNSTHVWEPEKKYSPFTRFRKTISTADYYKASPYDRQRILMQACVLDDGAESTNAIDLVDESVKYELTNINETIRIRNDTIEVSKAGAQMDLLFEPVENAELYLYFENIDFERDLAKSYRISACGLYDETKIEELANYYSAYTYIHHLYGGRHNWMLNLGVVPEKVNGIRIKFGAAGTYTLDGIHVYARKKDDILKNIHAMDHQVSNISFPVNEVKVSMENTEPEYLFAAIPYSEGWKAYDRGESVKILKADAGFMALQMEPGEHDIRFVYHTPGFIAGLLISLASVVCFAAILFLQKKHVRKHNNIGI